MRQLRLLGVSKIGVLRYPMNSVRINGYRPGVMAIFDGIKRAWAGPFEVFDGTPSGLNETI